MFLAPNLNSVGSVRSVGSVARGTVVGVAADVEAGPVVRSPVGVVV